MNVKKLLILDILETGVRIWAACSVFVYGFFKSTQFKGSKLIDTPIKEATNFEMMWAFFGTTQTYPIVIGCLQILGAILLVFQKTKLLGALLLTPIFLNIILLDVLYDVPFGALLNAILYQSVFFFVIIQQRQKITTAFNTLIIENDGKKPFKIVALQFLIGVVIAVVLGFMVRQLYKVLY